MTSIENLLLPKNLNQTIIALNPTSMFVIKPTTSYRTVKNMVNIDRPSFIAEFSSVSEFSYVEKASQYCDFYRSVYDMHALPSLRKDMNHNSSLWLESIRYEPFKAQKERRRAERKWMNTKLFLHF